MFQFGTGTIFCNPVGGNEATNPTPSQLLTVQSFKFDVKVTLVPLKGQNQFPDDVAPGDKQGSGSFAIGNNQILQSNNFVYAQTITSGIKQVAQETDVIPGTPFQVTVANSANFSTDLGVINATTGALMTKVASGPTAGQYSVAAGVYTFASADHVSGYSVKIGYSWTNSSAGSTLPVNNQLMGYGPIVEIWFNENYQQVSSNPNGLHIFNNRFGSIKQDIKRDGYLIPEYDFEAYANASGNVFEQFQVSI